MRTTNQFRFTTPHQKNAKDILRACLEEMLATIPDDSSDVEFHLNLGVYSIVNAKGEAKFDFCHKGEDSTISFSAPLTKTEGRRV
ncbi:hypothetical protein HQ49_02095 [Porphyromonas gulae]|nr:hypothetical protein HQ49_02095 [Porphyromonas gulae]